MAWVVARIGSTAGWLRALAAGWLLTVGCSGTEHAVFTPFKPTVVNPPPVGEAGHPGLVTDAGSDMEPELPDADLPDEDAGPAPDPGLDRRVRFDWKETLPGKGTCREGRYVGSFTCTLPPTGDAGTESAPLSGQVAFTLAAVSEEQVLLISTGSVKDPIGIVFSADLVGSLRCTDNVFEAYTEDGSVIGLGTFEAMLTGRFDPDELVIDGEFGLIDDSGQPCDGEFHVSAAP
jgi:hypothetical protein